MQITLKIFGSELFRSIYTQSSLPDTPFPRLFREQLLDWQIEYLPPDFRLEELLCFPEFPSALVLEAHNVDLIDHLQALEAQAQTYIRNHRALPLMFCPVIVTFRSSPSLIDMLDFPDIISDWMFAPIVAKDLARRILTCFKRKSLFRNRLSFGPLSLHPDSQSISYESRNDHLTQSEYMLAELFLNQLGMVVPFKDIVQMFRSTGKSAEANNIRVAIFQLRLKLDMLTKSHAMLANVYRHGYCLRLRPPRHERESHAPPARVMHSAMRMPVGIK